jgi:hypothetical protein
MPGRPQYWKAGGHLDESILNPDIADAQIDEQHLDSAVQAKLNQAGLWKEVQTVTVSTDVDTIEVDNIPASTWIKFLVRIVPSGSLVDTTLRLNDDSNNNYAYRTVQDNGSTANATAQGLVIISEDAQDENEMHEGLITNISGSEKLLKVESVRDQGTAGAGTVPRLRDTIARWTDTGLVTKISIFNQQSGSYGAGTSLSVYVLDTA